MNNDDIDVIFLTLNSIISYPIIINDKNNVISLKFSFHYFSPNCFNNKSNDAWLWTNVPWWKWVIMMYFFLTNSNYITHRMICFSVYHTETLFSMILFWPFVTFVNFDPQFRHVFPWDSIKNVNSSKSNYTSLNLTKIWI